MSIFDNKELNFLIEKCRKDTRIIALVLFGSHSKGKARKNSDIDICVILKDNYRFSEFEYFFEVSEKFDITFLEQLPFIMQNRVFYEGIVLVNNDYKLYKKIRKRIVGQYRGAEKIREKYNKKLIDSL